MYRRGDNLIIFCLLILSILLLLWGFKITTNAAEEIPQTEEFTYEEAQMLLQIAQAEAGNQGEDGMFLVLSTILNRRDSDLFPNTISGVITQPGQYYTAGMGKTEISPECHEALARIERGERALQIVAFEQIKSKKLEQYFCPAFEYRNHRFLTLKNK